VPNPAYATVAPIDAAEYAQRIDKLFARYPMESHLASLNLLESHDTARLLTTASEDKASLVLSTLLTMTFPGAPCVYYGSEVGVAGSFDPDCRRAFPWNETERDMDCCKPIGNSQLSVMRIQRCGPPDTVRCRPTAISMSSSGLTTPNVC
jgi:glycosidase